MVILIVEAVPANAAQLRQIAIDSRIDAWATNDYAAEIVREDAVVLCAIDTSMVGFLLVRLVPGSTEELDAELYNIAVRVDARRAGIGTLLMNDLRRRLLEKEVATVWLEVRESNRPAIKFYEKHGFVAQVTRPNFYVNPTENAVIMSLSLNDPDSANNA